MGVFRPLTDFVQSASPQGLVASEPRTHTFRIKQEIRRLSALIVRVQGNLSAGPTTTNTSPDYVAGLIRRLRLKVNDFKGPRNVVDLAGPQALSWARWMSKRDDRDNQVWHMANYPGATAEAGPPTGDFALNFVLNLKHPWFGEPWGNALSIPLSQAFLREDPTLEIDIGTAADVGTGATLGTFGGTAQNIVVTVQAYYENVPENFAYIPWELRTDEFPWTGSGRLFYEFPSAGWLAQFMLSNYAGAGLGLRSQILGPSGIYQVEYGRNIVDRTNDALKIADNDRSRNSYPLAATQAATNAAYVSAGTGNITLSRRNMPFEPIFDYLGTTPGGDAFSPASIWELNPQALQGDKMRVIYNDVATGLTAPRTRITHFRLLGTEQELMFLTKASS